ncbi:hypothetical protein ACIB24_05295 [Spongisporangium articulatum]|uniref:Uncharacterized protein n=1 Tax=Spongisporangium articulatum TaxID=3362603 RepID=A0ABW8AJD6_9ACTN
MSLNIAAGTAGRKPSRIRRRARIATAVAAFALLGAASPALAATQWSANALYAPSATWTTGGTTYNGAQFSVAKMGNSDWYASSVYYKFEPSGNTFFQGHVYNGTVGADNMKTACTLRWSGSPQVGIPLSTSNYSIGGHSHKDWSWSGGRYPEIANNWGEINRTGYVTCTLRVS